MYRVLELLVEDVDMMVYDFAVLQGLLKYQVSALERQKTVLAGG